MGVRRFLSWWWKLCLSGGLRSGDDRSSPGGHCSRFVNGESVCGECSLVRSMWLCWSGEEGCSALMLSIVVGYVF